MMKTTDMGKYHACCHPHIPHNMFVLRVKVQYTMICCPHVDLTSTLQKVKVVDHLFVATLAVSKEV